MLDLRNNIRSFRFSDKVFEILESFEGTSLNDKFNNLVLYCFEEIPKRKEDIKILDSQISQKRKTSLSLTQKLSSIDSLIRDLETIKRYGDLAVSKAKSISNE